MSSSSSSSDEEPETDEENDKNSKGATGSEPYVYKRIRKRRTPVSVQGTPAGKEVGPKTQLQETSNPEPAIIRPSRLRYDETLEESSTKTKGQRKIIEFPVVGNPFDHLHVPEDIRATQKQRATKNFPNQGTGTTSFRVEEIQQASSLSSTSSSEDDHVQATHHASKPGEVTVQGTEEKQQTCGGSPKNLENTEEEKVKYCITRSWSQYR